MAIPSGSYCVEHAVPFRAPEEVGMYPRGSQSLIVGRHDCETVAQPGIKVLLVARGLPSPRGGADVGNARGPVGPRNDRPTSLGHRSLRKIHRTRDGDVNVATDSVGRAVEEAYVLCGSGLKLDFREWLFTKHDTRIGGQRAFPDVEGGDAAITHRAARSGDRRRVSWDS